MESKKDVLYAHVVIYEIEITFQLQYTFVYAASASCKTWFYRATPFLSKIEHEQICRNRGLSIQAVLHSVDTQLHDLYEQKWQTKLNTDIAVRGLEAGDNKLRTYRKFKQHNISPERFTDLTIRFDSIIILAIRFDFIRFDSIIFIFNISK